jgi:hypothetical protein
VRASSRIGSFSKAAQIPEEGNGSLERESEQNGEGGWECKVCAGSLPNPSHGTKILGKMLLIKKAHEKSLTSKSKV